MSTANCLDTALHCERFIAPNRWKAEMQKLPETCAYPNDCGPPHNCRERNTAYLRMVWQRHKNARRARG